MPQAAVVLAVYQTFAGPDDGAGWIDFIDDRGRIGIFRGRRGIVDAQVFALLKLIVGAGYNLRDGLVLA